MQNSHIFCSTLLPSQPSGINTILFVESIRSFAGALSSSPIRIFTPEIEKEIPSQIIERLEENRVEIVRFDVNPEDLKFPFITEVKAAAKAETLAKKDSELLIWLTSNTIILKEPKAFLIPPEYKLGYRPVHHKLLGSGWNIPLDEFWSWVYEKCDVQGDSVFKMIGHVDGEEMRPYFNAGSFVVRPEAEILEAWKETFLGGYLDETLQALYKKDSRYAIFIHQAIFTGVILSKLKKEEIMELPSTYNYPSHLHEEDITSSKPDSLDLCHTIRHEGFYTHDDWHDRMNINKEMKNWMTAHLPESM